LTVSWYLPLIAFALLVVLERSALRAAEPSAYTRADHLLNLSGLAIQGALVPLAGYWIATRVLAVHWPQAAGTLEVGWLGAFLLNFVAVDFLYYWQHRLFHRVPALWALHRCHHASPTLSVWATSRNSLAVNFLFVYMLVNPVLGFLCDRPDAFFAAAAVTASLDLWRHSRLSEVFAPPYLDRILVTPAQHHAHHSPSGEATNFGANLILWDQLFGTARPARGFPAQYGTHEAQSPWRQFLFPW
jgi:sterol desaturase/sphingolipid hydroxylase (fatty acid hydroxylase superfamily)